MKTLKIKIIGTVQGVLFRKFIKDSADELKIKGFVRNLDDGSVELVIEGKDENVNELLRRCEEGPAHANIKKVDFKEISNQGFENFRVSSL